MSKVADYAMMNHDSFLLQPEGYNPSGSFKDNGMSTAVTHAKMLRVKKLICASTGNTSASGAMYAANENIECDVYIPRGEVAAWEIESSVPVWSSSYSGRWQLRRCTYSLLG